MSYEGPHPLPVRSGGSGDATITGVLTGNGTTPFTASPISQYNALVGNASNLITSVAPSATSGIPFISQGAAANPAFGTAVVAGGGTGATSLTAHSVLIGNGTSAIVQVGPVASTGCLLSSNGVGSDPGFTTATYPLTTTVSQILYSSATNTVTGLTTANNGTLVTSNTGVPSVLAGPGTTGNILQSNAAAAPSFSTATYPSSTTTQQILYSTAANVVGQLTTANSSLPATNSSGTLAMRAFSVVRQVFTSDGTYTPTSGMLYCDIECVGGGGAGGGAAATTGVQYAVGAGGGGGGYSRKTVSAATIGANQSVSIGAAGAGGTGTGGTGGTTSVGAIISAAGGVGGGAGLATASQAAVSGGAGGAGASGDFNTTGTPGGIGTAIFSAVGFAAGTAGFGGSSYFGGGAAGVAVYALSGTTAGAVGVSYGGGGGGALNGISQSAASGGNGVKGVVVVTEYVIA